MKNSKQTKGITLIALIITIIVLLILAGVTISMLTGDNGILKNSQTAKIETRAASVEEVRDIWLTEIEMAKITGGYAKTMDEILEQLQKEGLLSQEEVKIITAAENTNNEITIGSRTISFNVNYTPPEEIIQDKTAPVVSIEVTNITSSSVTLTVTATDNESGVKEYQYYLGEELKETLTTNSYEYTELIENAEYTIGVIVTDNAGNASEKKTTTIKTAYPTIAELKAGEYVNYVDKNGTTRKCIVLYDTAYNTSNGTNYGVQIITADTVETVELGNGTGSASYSTDATHFNTAKTSYNSAISTLNTRASSYLNTTYASSARCVGSVPNNPSSESGYFTGTYDYLTTYGWNGVFKNTDTNYTADWNQMNTLSIYNIGNTYWLASRNVDSTSSYSCVGVRRVRSSGSLDNYDLCDVDSDGYTSSYSYEYALRPVFTLKFTVKVTGGAGTSDDPWKLGT